LTYEPAQGTLLSKIGCNVEKAGSLLAYRIGSWQVNSAGKDAGKE